MERGSGKAGCVDVRGGREELRDKVNTGSNMIMSSVRNDAGRTGQRCLPTGGCFLAGH